jgi:hypothetical protein
LDYSDVLKTFPPVYLVGVVPVIYLVKMLNKSMVQISSACVLDIFVYQAVIFVVYFINQNDKHFVGHIILSKIQVIFLQHVVAVLVRTVKKQGKCKCEVCLIIQMIYMKFVCFLFLGVQPGMRIPVASQPR